MLIHHLRAALVPLDGEGMTDGQLLRRFVMERDESAFAALVRRHGPMVWGVCRRVLRSLHDAEDAFQATFLVLVRRAASVVPRETVANWLYGVAHQTARKARATAARRGMRERQVAQMPEFAFLEQDPWKDLQPLLDEELSRLPDKYRLAIVLCDLEGRTRKVVARQLKIPEGTLSGWLTRGRSLLAKRLARRGLAVSGAVLAALLTEAAAATAPPAILSSTIKAATLSIAGKVSSGLISAEVAALTKGVMNAMLLNKLKALTAILVVLSTIGIGAGTAMQTGRAETLPATVATMSKQAPGPREKLQQAATELEAARAKTKKAEADLAAARARLVEAEEAVATARARVAQLEANRTRSSEQADRTDMTAQTGVVAALAGRFKHRVPFEIGETEQSEGGGIEILEVWGTRPKIEVGGQYLVRGKFVLPAGERGMLYFYETADGTWGLTPIADLDLQHATLDMERGEFTLMHGMAGPGYFHLQLTDAKRYSRSFANVYFGTADNVWRKK